MKRAVLILSTLAILCCSTGRAKADPVFVNGGFEAGAGGFDGQIQSAPGWTFNLSYFGRFPYVAGPPSGYGPAPEGTNFVVLGQTDDHATDSIQQTVHGFTVGQQYTLQFSMAAEWPDVTNVRPAGAVVLFTLTGANIASASITEHNPSPTFTAFYNHFDSKSLTFTATATDVTFNLAGDPAFIGTGGEIGLDNFHLSSTVVPEPASLALFGMATAAAGCFGWRRRKQTVAV